MEIAKIKTALSVAKTHSFSEAAYEVSLSQSAVSKHIASVEEELGISLFVRSKSERTVKLTKEGEIFVKHAGAVTEAYDRLCRAISKARSEEKIPFTVGTIPVPSYGAFSPSALISFFYMHYPEIELRIVNQHQFEMRDALLEKKLDAAIVRILVERGTVLPPESWLFDTRITVDDICENPCLVAVSEAHPLAAQETVSLLDLKNENILLQRPVSSSDYDGSKQQRFNMFQKSCIDAGFEPNMLSPLGSSQYQGETAFKLVKHGQGVMIIHVPMQKRINGVKLIPLIGLDWSAKTVVISKAGSNRKLVERLICALNELVELP